MFDLEEQLHRWRQETETTLAFEPEEIDELEDHLKFAVEKAIGAGAAPELAWNVAVARLGASPPLAVEFAKSKLMPALFHLLRSWLPAGLLVIVFAFNMFSTFHMNWPSPEQDQVGPNYPFWITGWVSFVLLLLFLPGKTSRIAVLLGVGNAFCLIPLLHAAFYNSLADQIIGVGWSRMGAAFGWLPLSLSMIGLVMLNAWAWKRSGSGREDFPVMLGVAAAISLLLTVSPFCCELIGSLSIRDLYSMPTAAQITLTGDAKNQFMKWKFVDVLVVCVAVITTWVPLVLMAVSSLGAAALQGIIRLLKAEKRADTKVFPATSDLPWIMTLIASGVCWALASAVEPSLNQNLLTTEDAVAHAAGRHFGLAFMILAPALLFLICGYELTKRLQRADGLRLFYASMVTAAQAMAILGVMALPVLMNAGAIDRTRIPHSAEPDWLHWSLIALAVVITARQAWLLRIKARGPSQASLWKFEGSNLVQFGSLLGLNFACAGLILTMVALVLAFESTVMISALINWGNSIEHPLTDHFDPSDYTSPPAMVTQAHYLSPHIVFWIFTALTYVTFCLEAGLAVAIALSGLEFIRFNGWRWYRTRKALRERRAVLALNE
jgi:hypothetical protein